MVDFTDHSKVLIELGKSQDGEVDSRVRVRNAHDFIDKRDGQWENNVLNGNSNINGGSSTDNSSKPRYTFDLTTTVITQISSKLKKADFSGQVNPMGGEATKEIAETYDGMIRNIQNISNATKIYNSSAKSMITGGIDGWMVVQEHIDSDSFDQDLLIKNIENFVDRCWFDVSAEKQDRSDAMFGWKFTAFSKDEYKKKYPKGKAMGLEAAKVENRYFNKPDLIMVGEFFYIKEIMRELVLMSNNAVYEVNKKFNKIKKELSQQPIPITEVKRRKRLQNKVFVRMMDAGGWLDEEKPTVFEFIPLIPTYGNYKIADNKTIFYGAVEKRIDPQRVFNYAMSRQVEEGALAPRAKYWVTTTQAKGHTATLATMNTNSDPVQFYNADPESPGQPQQSGGHIVNPGLVNITQTAMSLVTDTAGLFAPSIGDGINNQSGVAIEKLQDRGDNGTIDYFEAQEIAICHTMRILIKAIPKVYVGDRQVRLMKEDGTFSMARLNETVMDEETQKPITLNDLTIGTYDVTCSAGASFQNRQQETVSAMVEIGGVDPSIVSMGQDVLLNNITSPGFKLLAERSRIQLINQGVIPRQQWTKEETEEIDAAQAQAQAQEPELSPEEMIGRAEMIKAQNEQKETDIGVQEKGAKIQLAGREQDRKDFETKSKVQMSGATMQMDQNNNQFDQFLAQQSLLMERITVTLENNKTMAQTLVEISKVLPGLIVGPGTQGAFIDQAENLHQSIEETP